MVMVNLPAARRHHRSRVGYALGLFVFLVVATALALVVRHPAFSATQQLAEPVPAPEITVAGEDGRAPAGEDARAAAGEEEEDGWSPTDPSQDEDDPDADTPPAGAGGGEALAERPVDDTSDLSRSLFYSGLLGLAISLAGLGLVGTRRRQW
ncbi:hypothetical protein ACFWDB_04500 [Micromonospora chalcea]|uniref:hypothetical protein n=1 Tax=Micromonospora sp. TSRI0369 TaxID=1703936 RepID=UPI00093A9F6F|nr:hypothetical protein [Micromonospora sp. TSRI0369]